MAHSRCARTLTGAVIALALIAMPAPALAQALELLHAIEHRPPIAADDAPASPRAGTRRASLLTRRDGLLLGGVMSAAVIVSHYDVPMANETREADHARLRNLSMIGGTLGGPVPLALSAAMYVGGRATRRPLVRRLGQQSARAVLLSGAGTVLVKGLVGRSRPFAAAEHADIYHAGRGFLDAARASFPSGHTSAAFAVATVLAAGTWGDPSFRHVAVPTLAFAGASFVGVSRVYANQHWSSDVIAGAALGVASGLIVVRLDQRRPREGESRGRLARGVTGALAHLSVAPSTHGLAIGLRR